MPFAGAVYEGRARSLAKMNRVIDQLSDEKRWCQKQLKTPDERYCIAGATTLWMPQWKSSRRSCSQSSR
jgi:hypothetical protein